MSSSRSSRSLDLLSLEVNKCTFPSKNKDVVHVYQSIESKRNAAYVALSFVTLVITSLYNINKYESYFLCMCIPVPFMHRFGR